MARAMEVARKLYGIRRDVRDSSTLSPSQKRKLNDALSKRVVMEFRNAMITTGIEGYHKRKMMDLDQNMSEIEGVSKRTAYVLKKKLSKLPTARAVFNRYPRFENRMLRFRDRVLQRNGDIDKNISYELDER